MITLCIPSMTGSSMSYIKSNSRKLLFKEVALSFLCITIKFRFFPVYQSFIESGMERLKPQLRKVLSTNKICVKLNIYNRFNAKSFFPKLEQYLRSLGFCHF